jgi:glutaredoxin
MTPELCEKHNLAVAADGKCVLCRRPERSVFGIVEQEEGFGSRITTWVLGACLLVAIGTLVQSLRAPDPYTVPHHIPAPPVEGPENPSPPEGATEAAELAVVVDAGAEVAQAPPEDAGPAAQSERAAATAEQPPSKPRRRPNEPPLPPEVLEGARREVTVTMYATPWCFICDRARDFLHAREVKLVERDVERDPTAAAELAKLNPTATVPVFVIAEQTHVGFSPWDLEDAINAEAAARHAAR